MWPAAVIGVHGMVLIAFALLVPLSIVVRCALAAAGFFHLAIAFGWRRGASELCASGIYVEATARGLERVTPEGTKPILTWDGPFGVALLASYGRPTGLLAFTTPSQTRYVPARIDAREKTDDELLARIAVLADLDLVDAVAHDAALSSEQVAEIVRWVSERDASALGRVFSSDGRRAPIALDRAMLSVGHRCFDLTNPIEWRPLVFHELAGCATLLYQATWIRQGDAEIVLVAPMPASIVPRSDPPRHHANGKLGHTLMRDLRLFHASAEPPPAREMRIPIDRPFMMSVRRMLDAAPLARIIHNDSA
ncbi:MAG: hypothetical protein FWD69_09860 [Polyangiaceae bacterium]|nr:hypothetical protein [Polyangiaceae bacterium]